MTATGLRTLMLLLPLLACTPLHRGPATDHFDGRRFRGPEPGHSLGDMLR